MEKVTINVFNTVGDSFCVEAEDGQKVFFLIKKALNEDKKVAVSFLNVELLTTAFLNTAIGQLYNHFSEEDIRERLTVEDLSKSGAVSLKRVVDTAKLYYKNPDSLEQSIKDILGE